MIQIRKLSIIIFILIQPTYQLAFDCDSVNFDCKNIQCESVICEKGYVLVEEIAEPCKCCSGCVKYKKKGEPCDESTDFIPIQSINKSCSPSFLTQHCQKDLDCAEMVCQPGLDLDKKPCIGRPYTDAYEEKDRNSDWFWQGDCDDTGKYKPKQCKGNRCFCTAESGKRIFGNFYNNTSEKVNCKCSLIEMHLANKAASSADFAHVSCQLNGNYQPLQCILDMCFCVDETTGEIIGTIVPITVAHQLSCYTEKMYNSKFGSLCQRERAIEEKVSNYYYHKGIKFEFLSITQCDPDGTFVAKQCDAEKCYCSNPISGEPIPGYVVSTRSVEANEMNCYCLREKLEMSADGGNLQSFDCNKNGNYKALACHGNICYCLDSDGYRDSVEKDVSPFFGNPCKINDTRVKACYIKNDIIECDPNDHVVSP